MMTRIYYEAHSTSREAAPTTSFARDLLRRFLAWQRRRAECRALLQMDDHLLRDIGVDRLQVREMTTRPKWRD